jgi:hypothetical protein
MENRLRDCPDLNIEPAIRRDATGQLGLSGYRQGVGCTSPSLPDG